MKVLLVSTVYPPVIGGPALQTQELASALTRHGHTATVVTTSPSTTLGMNEFEVVRLSQVRRGFDRVSRNLRLLRDLQQVMRRVQPDLVHMQSCEGNVPFAVGVVARAQRIPRLVKFSQDFVWARMNRDRHLGVPYEQLHSESLQARVLTRVQRATLAQYTLVWATSPFLEQSLRNIYGLPHSAIHELPNLMQLSNSIQLQRTPGAEASGQPKRESAELTALIVARLVPTKGVEVAIQAMALLQDQPIRLRIVGEGAPEYEASLRKLAEDLGVRLRSPQGVQPRIDFAGAVPPAQLIHEYNNADLLVLPSWYEAFGIVLVQAMAAGLPCIASNVGGIPSVVRDGETGLLVPAGSPSALAAALRKLQDPSLRHHMGEQGRIAAQQFNLAPRFDDLMAMYQRTLAVAAR